MHQKKIAKLKKFLPKNLLLSHSIPISNKFKKGYKLRDSKRKLLLHHNFSKLSYSIPLLSTLALLVVGLVATNPLGMVDKTSAVGNVIDVDYQRVMRSTATLTITPATSGGHGATNGVATEIIPGSVGYRAHDVSASVSDSTSYMLNLSYTENDKSLHLADGNMYLDPVPYDGVEGGDNFAEDNWGFAWGDKSDTDENMTYYQVPQYNTSGAGIKHGILELDVTGADRSASIDKKLVFAAKFSPNTIAGHYVASILLSLSATPNDISQLSELTRMQDITPQICRNTPVGGTNSALVIDIRDENNEDWSKGYNVIKTSDGNCWMNSNLALDLNGRTLTPADSNVKEDWESTTGPSGTWSGSTNNSLTKFWDGTKGYSGYKTEYGYYYTFEAATAGKGHLVTISMGEVMDQDICPRGWRLPSSQSDYLSLRDTIREELSIPLSGYLYIGNSTPYYNVNQRGYFWWGMTASASGVYFIEMDGYGRISWDTISRTYGLPVRCIAKRLGEG